MEIQSHEYIRVVPLYPTKAELDLETLGHGVKAKKIDTLNVQLTYRGGNLLTNVEVFTIFWGATFHTGALKALPDKINHFFDTILQSTLMDQMQEYNTGNYKFGKGKRTGSIIISKPAPKKTLTDSHIQTQLQSWITSNGTFPKPNNNTLYFIYLQKGVSVAMGGSKSCSSFCGYHDNVNNVYYAVMPYPGCSGCLGNMTPFDALAATSSHELCEAMTDAVPGSGWYNDNFGEIGDICAWQFKSLDGYNVQLEWSNKANHCI